MLFPPIYGQIVTLKNITPDEVTPQYVNWLNDPKVNQYLQVRHYTVTLDTQKAFIEAINKSSNAYIFGIFVEGNRMIGTTKLGPIDSNLQSGEIGILIGDSEYWNKNVATEVIEVLCGAFHRAGILLRASAGAAEQNIGSIKAFKKNGFVIEEHQLSFEIDENGARTNNVVLTKIF